MAQKYLLEEQIPNLDGGGDERACEQAGKAVGGHGAQDCAQTAARHLLQTLTHDFHAVHQ